MRGITIRINLKSAFLCSIIFLLPFYTLISALSNNGYWLIVYYEEDDPKLGELITINAELYQGCKRIAYSVTMFISIEMVLQEEEVEMVHQGKGIFSYNLVIPSNYNQSYLDGEITACINEEPVKNRYFEFEIEIDKKSESESGHIEPFHIINTGKAAIGDTIQIITYISLVKDGEIEPNDVNITIEFLIYDFSENLYINSTYNKTKGIYQEGGYFLTCYTIPSNLTLDYKQYWEAQLEINIITSFDIGDSNYKSFQEKRTVLIGVDKVGFNIISKYDLHENQIDYHILTLNNEFQPVSNVSFEVRLIFYDDNYQILGTIDIFPPNTNIEGHSTFNIQTNLNFNEISVNIYAKKENITLRKFFPIYTNKYNYFSDFFHVSPTLSSLEYYVSYCEQGFWMEYRAFMGNLPLQNKEIFIYVGWKNGIIQISTTKTNSEGCFKLLFPWPSNIKPQYRDFPDILFSYYNGTNWFESSYCPHYYFSHYSLIAIPEFLTIQENITLNIEEIDYSIYKILNFSYNLPPEYINSRSGLYCISVFKNEYRFIEDSTFSSYYYKIYPDKILPGGVVQTACLIDSSQEVEFILIVAFLRNESFSNYHYLVWVLNPDGSLRELPEAPAKPFIYLDPGFSNIVFRVILFVIVLSVCVGIILWTKHHSR